MSDLYAIVGVERDMSLPATPTQLGSLHRGICAAAHLDGDSGDASSGMLCEPCTECQTADCDGSFSLGDPFMQMPDCNHCFHTGCLELCLRDQFSCPSCFAANLKKAYRKKAPRLHPDHGGDTQQMEELTQAHEVLKDRTKRRHYDDTGEVESSGPAGFMAGTPCIKVVITREQHRAGGTVPVNANGISTEVVIQPGQQLPIKIEKPPWPGQPAGAKITIEVEDSGCPVHRDFLRIDLPISEVDSLPREALKDQIQQHRQLVVSCESLAQQAERDAKAKRQHRLLERSEFLGLPKNVKNLRHDGVTLAEAGSGLVYTCELTGTFSFEVS